MLELSTRLVLEGATESKRSMVRSLPITKLVDQTNVRWGMQGAYRGKGTWPLKCSSLSELKRYMFYYHNLSPPSLLLSLSLYTCMAWLSCGGQRKDNLQESVLSLHNVCTADQTQVTKLGSSHPLRIPPAHFGVHTKHLGFQLVLENACE